MKPSLDRLESGRVILAPFAEHFVSDEYLSWLADEETTRWLVSARSRIDRNRALEFCRTMIKSPDDCFFAVLRCLDHRHVGNVRIGAIDWACGTTRFGMMIGDTASRGHGLGTDIMTVVESFAFGTLGMKTMRFPVVEAHRAAMRMYEKRGFSVDGYWPEDFVRDGKAYPMVAMVKVNPGMAT